MSKANTLHAYGGEEFRAIKPSIEVNEIQSVDIRQDFAWRFQTSSKEGIRVIVEALRKAQNLSEPIVYDMLGEIRLTLKRPRISSQGNFQYICIPISPLHPERHLGQPILDAFLKLKQMKNQGIIANEYRED